MWRCQCTVLAASRCRVPTRGREEPEVLVVHLDCQRVGVRLRPRRSAVVRQVGAKVAPRRLVSARENEAAQGHCVGPRRVGVPDRFTNRAGTEK